MIRGLRALVAGTALTIALISESSPVQAVPIPVCQTICVAVGYAWVGAGASMMFVAGFLDGCFQGCNMAE